MPRIGGALLLAAGLFGCKPAAECEVKSPIFGELLLATAEESFYFQNEQGYISISLKDCGVTGCKADVDEVGIHEGVPFTRSEEVVCR